MMKCIIVEDQPPAQRILKRYMEQVDELELMATFSDATSAREYLKKNEVDVIFLDIHLPRISGIEFLKSLHFQPKVVLTTAFSEYALEGYELNVMDYLLKPFSFQRFEKAVQKVRTINAPLSQASDSFFFKSGHHRIHLKIEELWYIMSDGDYTEIHCSDQKYVSSESLKFWSEKLQRFNIHRSHKSFLVNITKIKKVSSTKIVLVNEVSIPIGRAFKDQFKELLD